ncbi:MAG: hypothetical protein NT121_15615, partial [Chloroflexi bacterium]|nr:hypothetical protein [Chloroflexota bacterium]
MSVRCLAGLTALVLLFLNGCGGKLPPVAQLVKPAAPLPQVEKMTAWPSQTPVPSPTRSIQAVPDVLPVYVIDALMDYDAKTLDVRQTIDFTNNADVAITDMLLAVLPNQIPGVFQLMGLMLGDQDVTDYRLNGQRLSWRLASQLQPGETIQIKLVYLLRLPVVATVSPNSNGNQVFGVQPLQVNLTDWYPMLVPFDPETGWKLAEPQNYG